MRYARPALPVGRRYAGLPCGRRGGARVVRGAAWRRHVRGGGAGRRAMGRRSLRRLMPALLAAALLFAVFLELRLAPVVRGMSATRAQTVGTRLVSDAMEAVLADGAATYSALVRVSRDNAGRIDAVEADALAVNTLLAKASKAIVARAEGAAYTTMKVPVGTLTGLPALYGRGFALRFRMGLSGGVTASLQSRFESAGINQTLHVITLHVVMTVHTLIPGGTAETAVAVDYLVAETVLVGAVPSLVTRLGEINM